MKRIIPLAFLFAWLASIISLTLIISLERISRC